MPNHIIQFVRVINTLDWELPFRDAQGGNFLSLKWPHDLKNIFFCHFVYFSVVAIFYVYVAL